MPISVLEPTNITGSILGLTALLAACRDSDDVSPLLCATMQVGGRSLVEYQAHVARDAGADTFVVYVERVSTDLRQAVERLAQAGFRVKLARGVNELVDHIHPADRLLLVADGMIISPDIVERLISYPGNAVATVADIPENVAMERLDGRARWAGLAVMDAGHTDAIRSMPDDWDVQSTLLRAAIQNGIAQLPIDDMVAPAGDAVLHLIEERDGLADVDQRLLIRKHTEGVRGDWITRSVYGPLGRMIGPLLLRYGVGGFWLSAIGIFLQVMAIGFFAVARPWPGLLALLLAGPVYALAQMLGTVRRDRAWLFLQSGFARQVLDGAVLLAFGWGLVATGQGWVQLVLVLVVMQHVIYLRWLAPVARGADPINPLMEPGGDMLAWSIVPFGLFLLWHWVPMMLAIWLVTVFILRKKAALSA